MTQGYKEYRVGFSGDVGGQTERPYTIPYEPLPFVDMLIHECTYCQPTRPNSVKDRPKDIEKIETVVNDSHKILFPCFSLQRTQELLTVLYEMWKIGYCLTFLSILIAHWPLRLAIFGLRLNSG